MDKKDQNLWVNYECSWKNCENDTIKKIGNRINLTTYINSSDKDALTSYINSVAKNNGTNKPFDNSTNIYIVHFKDSTFKVSTGEKWIEYQKMTDKVLK